MRRKIMIIPMKKETKNETDTLSKIKTIINNWAVDDDEHELLERIADIIGEVDND
jgi:hypothetical protein